jgi:hypothetical protein
MMVKDGFVPEKASRRPSDFARPPRGDDALALALDLVPILGGHRGGWAGIKALDEESLDPPLVFRPFRVALLEQPQGLLDDLALRGYRPPCTRERTNRSRSLDRWIVLIRRTSWSNRARPFSLTTRNGRPRSTGQTPHHRMERPPGRDKSLPGRVFQSSSLSLGRALSSRFT